MQYGLTAHYSTAVFQIPILHKYPSVGGNAAETLNITAKH
jgi:hypothetical protein